jgi:serine protease Do
LTIRCSETLVCAKLGSSASLQQGQTVYSVGNSLGLGIAVSNGVVELLPRTVEGASSSLPQIFHSAAFNDGSTGGGLFDGQGNLIGLLNGRYERENGPTQGMNLASAIDEAYPLLRDLIDWGYVRGLVSHGLSVIQIDLENLWHYAYTYGLDEVGVYVIASRNTPELRQWDQIVSIAGVAVNTEADIEAAIVDRKIGDVVDVVLRRDQKERTVKLELVEYIPPDLEIIW